MDIRKIVQDGESRREREGNRGDQPTQLMRRTGGYRIEIGPEPSRTDKIEQANRREQDGGLALPGEINQRYAVDAWKKKKSSREKVRWEWARGVLQVDWA